MSCSTDKPFLGSKSTVIQALPHPMLGYHHLMGPSEQLAQHKGEQRFAWTSTGRKGKCNGQDQPCDLPELQEGLERLKHPAAVVPCLGGQQSWLSAPFGLDQGGACQACLGL